MPTPFPQIKTKRLLLRSFHPSDDVPLFQLRSDPTVMAFMGRSPLASIEGAQRMILEIQKSYSNRESIVWVITTPPEDIMVGYIGFVKWSSRHHQGEIAYALSPMYWGNGLMSEAMGAVLKFGFNQMDLKQIEANIDPENTPSRNLLNRFSFRKTALLKNSLLFDGKWLDSEIYQLDRDSHTEPVCAMEN